MYDCYAVTYAPPCPAVLKIILQSAYLRSSLLTYLRTLLTGLPGRPESIWEVGSKFG